MGKNPLLLLHGDDADVAVAVVNKVTTNNLFFNNSSSFSYAFPVSTVTNTVTQVDDVVADTNNVSDDDDNDYVLEDDNDADDEDRSILLSMPMDFVGNVLASSIFSSVRVSLSLSPFLFFFFK